MWYPLYFLIHLKLSQGFHDLLHQVKYLKLQADEQMRSEIFQAFLAVKVLSSRTIWLYYLQGPCKESTGPP